MGFSGTAGALVAHCCPVGLRSASSPWSELTGTSEAAESRLLDQQLSTGWSSRLRGTQTDLHAQTHKQQTHNCCNGILIKQEISRNAAARPRPGSGSSKPVSNQLLMKLEEMFIPGNADNYQHSGSPASPHSSMFHLVCLSAPHSTSSRILHKESIPRSPKAKAHRRRTKKPFTYSTKT